MATARELGAAYEIEALRLTVDSGALDNSPDLRAAIGQLASDYVDSQTSMFTKWKIIFLGSRAEDLGAQVAAKIGTNPLDVDPAPGVPADLLAAASSDVGQVAAGATVGGAGQQAADQLNQGVADVAGAVGDVAAGVATTARNVVYIVVAAAALALFVYVYVKAKA